MTSFDGSDYLLSADWVYPVSAPPIQDGAIFVSSGIIQEVASRRVLEEKYPDILHHHHPQTLLMPGLVNTHVHLEYTGLGPLSREKGFVPWILELVQKSRTMSFEDQFRSALLGCQMMLYQGVTAVAEVSYSGEASLEALKRSGLGGVVYLEVFGTKDFYTHEEFLPILKKVERAQEKIQGSNIRIGLSPHAPYTVSPALWKQVLTYAEKENLPITFHMAESREETLLVQENTGPFNDLYYPALGFQKPSSLPSGLPPALYLKEYGLLAPGGLAVHGLELSPEEMALLEEQGVGLSLCPGSNLYLHGKLPNLPEMMRVGLMTGLGTDSHASNPAFSLWEEMRLLKRAFREKISLSQLLEMGTLRGAQILGDRRSGCLEKGKKADIIGIVLQESGGSSFEKVEKTLLGKGQIKVAFTMIQGQQVYPPMGKWLL